MADILTNRTALTQPDSGDFLHIVDISDLTDNAAGTSKKITAAQLIGVGTAFPTSNLWDGMPFHRTDIGTGLDCYYDATNTQWLTSDRQYLDLVVSALSANNNSGFRRYSDTYAVWFDEIVLTTRVATTNDGTNNWTINLVSYNKLFSSGTSVYSISTGTTPDTAGAYTDHSTTSPTTPNPANYGGFRWEITKNSSPGNLDVVLGVYTRQIIT